jgi:hypothetical protein
VTNKLTTFQAELTEVFADSEKRTIKGLAIPASSTARKSGYTWSFAAGSVEFAERTPVLNYHDTSQPVGRVSGHQWTARGLEVTFAISRIQAGNDALTLAADGVLAISVGIEVAEGGAKLTGDQMHIMRAFAREVSLTPVPAFGADSVIDSVKFHQEEEEPEMGDENKETVAPQVTVQFDSKAFAEALAEAMPKPVAAPAIIPAGDGVQSEPGNYNFSGDGFKDGGKFEFAADLKASKNDPAAEARVMEFMAEQFAVVQSDVNELNPAHDRQDLYVDRKEYEYPLWASVAKETLADPGSLILPKYNSSSGLVNTMTEGVEPAPGAFTVTSQTITPTEVGGKVEISRALWNLSGTRVSNLIFSKMQNAWYEALEAKVVAVLNAETPTGITLTTNALNKALSGEIAAAFADLQIVRGGFRFDVLAAQIDLYKRLATAVTDDGEPLFPQLNPANRNGTAAARFARMNVHGVDTIPSWALAASGAVAASSYLFDTEAVYAAATVPERLEWNFGTTVQDTTNLPQVSMVTIGIHGYSAAAVIDLAGVREVIYDPTT